MNRLWLILALVATLNNHGANVAFVARHGDRVREVAREHTGTHGSQGDVSPKDDSYPIAMQITAALGGRDGPLNQATPLAPGPLAARADPEKVPADEPC